MSCVTKGVSVRWIFVREYCAEATVTVHARPGRGAEGVLGFSGRADDRGPAGARGPGRLTLRDRRAPYYTRYRCMNGRTAGGTAARRGFRAPAGQGPAGRADIRPGDGGGDL